MRYKMFGNTGLKVSQLCLGTMTFGTAWGWGSDREESRVIFDSFLEAGGNFIDTANRYTEGESEQYLGEFIQGQRDALVIASKYTLHNGMNQPNLAGNSRKNMIQSVEKSLKRLRTDYLDILWLHAWDALTPVEEVMRAFDDLVRAGKVMYIGISDTPAWLVSRANTLAELRGWTSFAGLQVEYSLIERTPERDLMPMADAFGMCVTAWSPLASGILTGKYNTEDPDYKRDWAKARVNETKLRISAEVVAIAKEIGHTPAQVAINWVRQQAPLMIPIIGARKLSQLDDNMRCLDFKLEEEHLERLDQVSAISLGFPHEFLADAYVKEGIYANTWDKIDKTGIRRN